MGVEYYINKTNTENNTLYQQNNSTILDLETLKVQYNNLLTSYTQAVANYVNFVNSNGNSQTDQMVQLPGNIYLGSSTLSTKTSANVQDCEASCIKETGCTGAIFNSKNLTCSLKNGQGAVVSSSDYNIAIVNEAQYLIKIIDDLNTQLTTTNQSIQDINANTEPIYNQDIQVKTSQDQKLTSDYNMLLEERKEIENMIRQYEKLDKKDTQTSLSTNQNYYSYLVLIVFALLIVYMLISISSMTTTNFTNTEGKPTLILVYLIICIVIIIFFGINFYESVYTTATNYFSTTNFNKNASYLEHSVNIQGIAVIIILLIIIYVYYLRQI